VEFKQGYALSVGIGSFRHTPQLSVHQAKSDAMRIAEVLRDPRICAYPASHVEVLCDEQATRTGLLNALTKLAERATPEATIFLFISCHGIFGTNGEYYLATHDVRLADGAVVPQTGLSHRELISQLTALQSRRAVLIFNSCFAGTMLNHLGPLKAGPGLALPEKVVEALLDTGAGRFILTACREHQYSYLDDGPLSVFAAALVESLHGHGLPNHNGFISVFDLYRAIYQRVREQYQNQEPTLTVQQGIGDLFIARHSGETSASAGVQYSSGSSEALPIRWLAQELARQSRKELLAGASLRQNTINIGQITSPQTFILPSPIQPPPAGPARYPVQPELVALAHELSHLVEGLKPARLAHRVQSRIAAMLSEFERAHPDHDFVALNGASLAAAAHELAATAPPVAECARQFCALALDLTRHN
jgi:hypothetical protein